MKLVIIVPIYKSTLTKFESVSFNQLCKLYSTKYDIVLVCPESLDIQTYLDICPNAIRMSFDDIHFKSEETYSQFMCLPDLYEKLVNKYDYMFIYQLDALVFYDNIESFIKLGYDYYGAPWFKNMLGNGVGNGGFCLRKIKPFYDIASRYTNTGKNENGHYIWEDQWFCIIHRNELNIAPPEIASRFALCSESPEEYFKRDILPMGAHKLFEHKYQTEFYNKYLNRKA